MHIQPDHVAPDPGLFCRRFPAFAKGEAAAMTAAVDSSVPAHVTPTAGDSVVPGAASDAACRYTNTGPRRSTDGSGVAVAGDPAAQELAALAKMLQGVTGILRQDVQGGDKLAADRTVRLAERFESLSLLSDSEPSMAMARTLAVVRAARDGVQAAPPVEITTEAEPAPSAREPEVPDGKNQPGADVLAPGVDGLLRPAAVLAETYLTRPPAPPEFSRVV